MGPGFPPVMPALAYDVLIHKTVDENGLGVIPPGPAKVGGMGRAVSQKAATVHHIAVSLAFGRGGGGHIAVDRPADIF